MVRKDSRNLFNSPPFSARGWLTFDLSRVRKPLMGSRGLGVTSEVVPKILIKETLNIPRRQTTLLQPFPVGEAIADAFQITKDANLVFGPIVI
jgi:hypothetical protein